MVDSIVRRAKDDSKKLANIAALAAVTGTLMLPVAATALTRADIANLTYSQIKGTGMANHCPEVITGSKGAIKLDEGKQYKLVELCLEPKSFQVRNDHSPRKFYTPRYDIDVCRH